MHYDISERNRKVEENMGLVVHVAKKMAEHNPRSTCVELSDLIQEGYIALIKAVEKFDPKKGEFTPFAVACIKTRIRNVINKLSKNNGQTVSLEDNKYPHDDIGTSPWINFIPDETIDPETQSIGNNLKEIINYVSKMLKPKEQKVLELRYLKGKSLEETRKILEYSTTETVRQIEQRALNKLRHPSRSRFLKPYIR